MSHRFLLAAALAAFPLCGSLAAADLIDSIPADAPALVRIRDMGELRALVESSPLGRTWEEPSVQRYFAPLRRQLGFEEGSTPSESLEPKELLQYIEGEVVLAILGPITGQQDFANGAVVIADVGSNGATIAGLILADDERHGKRQMTEEFLGATLHTALVPEEDAPTMPDGEPAPEPATELWWTTIDNHFLIAPNGAALRKAVSALRNSPDLALVNTPVWQEMRSAADAEVVVVLNVPALLPLYELGLESLSAAAQQNPTAPTADAVRKALRLDAINGLVMTLDVGADRTVMHGSLLARDAVGILRFSRAFEGQPRTLGTVPGDVAGVGAMTLSLSDVLNVTLEIAAEINPMMAGMAQGFLMQTKQQRGLDVLAFLASVDRSWTFVSGYGTQPENISGPGPRVPTDTVFTAALTDAAAFEAGLTAIQTMAGPALTQTEFNGRRILSAAMPQQPGAPAQTFAIAAADGRAFISIGSLQTLEAMLGTGRGNGWSAREVRAFVEGLGPEVNAYSYTYPEASIGTLRLVLATLTQGPAAAQFGALVDPSASIDYRALASLWGASTSRGWRDTSGFHQENVIEHRPE